MFKSALIVSLCALALAACAGGNPVRTAEAPPPAPVEPEAPPAVIAAPAAQPDEPPAPMPPELIKPEQVANGKYRIGVASERTSAEAAKWVKKLEGDGLRAETEAADIGGTSWQRVVVPGLRNKADAAAMVAYLDQALGMKGAWVVPRVKAAPATVAAPAAPAAPAEPAAVPVPMPAPAQPAPPPDQPRVPDADQPKN